MTGAQRRISGLIQQEFSEPSVYRFNHWPHAVRHRKSVTANGSCHCEPFFPGTARQGRCGEAISSPVTHRPAGLGRNRACFTGTCGTFYLKWV